MCNFSLLAALHIGYQTPWSVSVVSAPYRCVRTFAFPSWESNYFLLWQGLPDLSQRQKHCCGSAAMVAVGGLYSPRGTDCTISKPSADTSVQYGPIASQAGGDSCSGAGRPEFGPRQVTPLLCQSPFPPRASHPRAARDVSLQQSTARSRIPSHGPSLSPCRNHSAPLRFPHRKHG